MNERRLRLRRRLVFAAVAMSIAVVGTTAVLLVADLYLHHRAERSAGLNRWGYRGPVVARKQPGETRIAILGGSTVFGYGVFWEQALPAQLERELRNAAGARKVSVINLGFNNEGAFALEPTLDDFDYLNIDVAAFYTGYNDAFGDLGPNTVVYRHQSPIFRMFGYYPILPLILKEKAIAIRSGGQLNASNEATAGLGVARPVFTPSLAGRASAAAMDTAANIGDALSAQLDRLSRAPAPAPRASDAGCRSPWVGYCDSLYRAIVRGRTKGMKIAVVLPPLLTHQYRETHQQQQHAAKDMVHRKFQHDTLVRVVDLSQAVDLTDRHVSFDAMHLDPDGNAIVASALAPHLQALMETAPSPSNQR